MTGIMKGDEGGARPAGLGEEGREGSGEDGRDVGGLEKGAGVRYNGSDMSQKFEDKV